MSGGGESDSAMAEAGMTDLFDGGVVEIEIDSNGKLWVNVDGRCRLRIGRVGQVSVQVFHPEQDTGQPVKIFEDRDPAMRSPDPGVRSQAHLVRNGAEGGG